MRTTTALLLAAVVVAIAAAVVAWWTRRRGPPPSPGKLTGPLPILADMINAVNYDMRSVELGRWLLTELQTQIEARGCGGVDYESIAAAVPGANDVTKTELQKHLRDLVAYTCASSRAPPAETLQQIEIRAFDAADGALTSAYADASPVALP
jgi:hypothetical protein